MQAICSPLLETSIDGAKGIIVNITAPDDIGLEEIDVASSLIAEKVDPEAKYIWGVSFDNRLEDRMNITVIATGFNGSDVSAPKPAATPAAAQPAPQAAPAAAPAPEAAPVSTNSDIDDLIRMLTENHLGR